MARYQSRAARVFFSVSRVPKDLLETMNRVVSGLSRAVSSRNSLPSILAS
jgi:hypothetical protein